MLKLNLTIFETYILPGLLTSTLLSLAIAVAIGSLIGVIVGATQHRIARTILPAIRGSFFGVLLMCMMPLYSMPGIVQGWGMGGGLGSLIPAFLGLFLGSIGSITGALVGSTSGFKFFQRLNSLDLLKLLAIAYGLMIICIYLSFTLVCFRAHPSLWYCTQVGFGR